MHGLTAFQYDVLAALAAADDSERYGLGLKQDLEATDDYENVNHGRLYPNLDDLVKKEFVEKTEVDGRTNLYEITTDGVGVLQSRVSDLERGL